MAKGTIVLSNLGDTNKSAYANRRSFFEVHLGDIASIAFLVVVALAYLSPALKDGLAFGPATLGRQLSVLTTPHQPLAQIHNVINGDIVTQGAAWNTLNWTLVHHGQFPLWNDQSATGLPQFLNFESAPLALPSLISYLFPLRISYLVTVLIKLLIAGTGTYAVVRLIGGRPLAGTLAGTTAMLSGSFAGWLGWSISGPLAWTGWIVAAAILIYRATPGNRGWRYTLLAFASAFCIYGGFPEDYVLMAGALLLLVGVGGLAIRLNQRQIDWQGVGRIGVGFTAGLALAAPLWLPGITILRGSARTTETASTGLPLHAVTLLVAQGYYGLPLGTPQFPHSTYFGPLDYFETAAYVGVIALVLAGTCIALAWRRPVVIGLLACTVGSALVTYDLTSGAPVQHLIYAIGLGTVALQRVLTELDFAIAVLAGLGFELLLRRWREPYVQRIFASVVGLIVLVVALLWAHSTLGNVSINGMATLTGAQATAVRRRSLYWPSVETVVLVLVALAMPLLARQSTRRRSLGEHRIRTIYGGLVGIQAILLIVAGVGINSYAPTSYPKTSAVLTLKRIVGTSLFGFDGASTPCTQTGTQPCGLRQWDGVGIYPEMNLGYGLTEFAMHDPVIPRAYFADYPVKNDDRNGHGTNIFAPVVNSVRLARLYGIKYVIVQPPQPIPSGMRLVRTIVTDNTHLEIVSVPGSHRFSFTSKIDTSPVHNGAGKQTITTTKGSPISQNIGDKILRVTHPNNARYVLMVRTLQSKQLAIRITDVPGWHASADGHSLALHRAQGDLMSAIVPAGTRRIVLSYDPTLLQVGELFALVSLASMAIYAVVERYPRPRRRSV